MRFHRIVLTILFALIACQAQAADLWRPKGQPAFVDSNGDPYAGAKLCFFDSGTTNQTSVYKDSGASQVWAQPITLNAGGGLDDPIYVQTGAFKEKLMASTATTCDDSALYTSDEIPGAFDTAAFSVTFARPDIPVLSKASHYTVVADDLGKLINVDATGGAVTITLISAADAGDGAYVAIKKTDASANAVTITPVGGQTIDGDSSRTISYQYSSRVIVSNGSNWSVLSTTSAIANAVATTGIQDLAVTFGKLATSVYDTDGTLAANSNSKLPTQAATKTYVDTAVVSGVKWKDPVRVATTANGTLATAFENGDTVDGTVLATNDRILLKDQSTSADKGIYVVQASGAPVRATDADTAAEINGATVYVSAGSANIGTQYTQSAVVVTLGTDSQTWSLIAAANTYTASTCLDLTGQAFSVEAGCIGTTQIATDGVDSAEIAANAVGSSEIATDAVGSAEIAAGAVDTSELSTAVNNRLRDVGEIITFAGTTCPTFSLEANGAAISRSTYSSLFSALSTLYGTGDGSTTFNLPDYRGYFLRGWDHAAGNDPNAASRTNAGGGTTGDNVGTKQADAFEAHTHSLDLQNSLTDNIAGGGSNDDMWKGESTTATQSTGGSETRPQNINVLYCIYAGA